MKSTICEWQMSPREEVCNVKMIECRSDAYGLFEEGQGHMTAWWFQTNIEYILVFMII